MNIGIVIENNNCSTENFSFIGGGWTKCHQPNYVDGD